jgi:cytochrome c2
MNRCVRVFAFAALGAFACMSFSGCDAGQARRAYSIGAIGNARHGKELISSYGCGACHMVPGVQGARGLVGPPLYYIANRTIIAGELPNTPDNLTRWIQHPRAVDPKTAMPELGVSEADSYDIAAFLYTLRGEEKLSWND